jgi:hypothetical protein
MHTVSSSFNAATLANSQKVTLSAVTALSAAITSPTGFCIVTVDIASWYIGETKVGAGATAVADGTCQYLCANVPYRIGIATGTKLAFISTAAGNVYITPEV